MNKFAVFSGGTLAVPSHKANKYIEVVGSSNPRLNAMSKDSQHSIQAVLKQRYSKVKITLVDSMADLESLVSRNPDLVVLGMKLVLLEPSLGYEASPKVWLSNYLNVHGIAFTGSDAQALNYEYDKHIAKQKVLDADLRSAAFFTADIGQPIPAHTLRFPLFVKPTNRGDSKGIDEASVVSSELELTTKIKALHLECQSNALIEEYLPGREFSVAVIKQPGTRKFMAMPIEITSPADNNGNRFLSHAVKEADSEKVSFVKNAQLRDALNTLAIGVFKALGSRDYGRIDLRLDEQGTPCFIEANLMPGLSDHGYLARCFALNKGITYSDMIMMIVGLGLARKEPAVVSGLLSELVPIYGTPDAVPLLA